MLHILHIILQFAQVNANYTNHDSSTSGIMLMTLVILIFLTATA